MKRSCVVSKNVILYNYLFKEFAGLRVFQVFSAYDAYDMQDFKLFYKMMVALNNDRDSAFPEKMFVSYPV